MENIDKIKSLQTYFEFGKRKKDVGDYYAAKTNVLMGLVL